uniref:Uncharacterized protein n=1 Tax=Photinus pyralis TaxID=7054 RepID=A0A1Y1KZI3_PHOPY
MRICIFKLTAVVPTLLVFTRCVCRTNMILEAVDQFAPQSAFQMLMSVVVCTFLVWYAQYHWNRRRLYRMASKFDGPMCLPFIGNGLYFVGSTRGTHVSLVSLHLVGMNFRHPAQRYVGR